MRALDRINLCPCSEAEAQSLQLSTEQLPSAPSNNSYMHVSGGAISDDHVSSSPSSVRSVAAVTGSVKNRNIPFTHRNNITAGNGVKRQRLSPPYPASSPPALVAVTSVTPTGPSSSTSAVLLSSNSLMLQQHDEYAHQLAGMAAADYRYDLPSNNQYLTPTNIYPAYGHADFQLYSYGANSVGGGVEAQTPDLFPYYHDTNAMSYPLMRTAHYNHVHSMQDGRPYLKRF